MFSCIKHVGRVERGRWRYREGGVGAGRMVADMATTCTTLSRGPPPLGEELDGKDSCPCLPDCHCVVGILTFGTCLGIICEQTWDLGPMGGGILWVNFKPNSVPFFFTYLI